MERGRHDGFPWGRRRALQLDGGMILAYVHAEIAGLFGAVVTVRTLMHGFFPPALEYLVSLQRRLPAVPLATVLTAVLVLLRGAHVLRVWIPVEPMETGERG